MLWLAASIRGNLESLSGTLPCSELGKKVKEHSEQTDRTGPKSQAGGQCPNYQITMPIENQKLCLFCYDVKGIKGGTDIEKMQQI